MNEIAKYKYISILRCRTWCIWPEHSRTISKGMRVAIGPENDDSIYLSIHLVSYAARPRPENQPAKACSEEGPIIWHGNMETGYWAGQLFIKAPEDTVDVAIEHKHPYEGEIDVQLHIATPKEYSIDKLRDVVQTISFSVLSYFNVSAGELLIPVAPIQIRELGESNSTFQNSVTIRVKERRTFSAEFLQEAIERFVVTRCRMSGEEAAALDAAMRRYLDSITETDEIDKYCDFWETCEFATLGVNAKGGKVGRIAQALSDHMRKTNPTFSKRNIENRLRIKELYAARGAIVHNAIQNPSILKERSGLLSEVALELIRFRLDLPYKRNQVIEEAYQRVSTNQA